MGKRTVGKANKGINVKKNNNRFKIVKLKKERKKRETPQNCKSPTQRQRFITIKNVTKKKKA